MQHGCNLLVAQAIRRFDVDAGFDPAMAQALGTEPILVVAKQTSFNDSPVTPLPVDTAAITNGHLSYAITWFSLAAIWVAMMDLSSCLVTR